MLVAIWHQLIFGLGSFDSNAQDSDDWFTVAVGVVNIVGFNDVVDVVECCNKCSPFVARGSKANR